MRQKLQRCNFLKHYIYDDCQTLHDSSTHSASPIHATFSDLDRISLYCIEEKACGIWTYYDESVSTGQCAACSHFDMKCRAGRPEKKLCCCILCVKRYDRELYFVKCNILTVS